MTSETGPYVDDVYAAAQRQRPSLLARTRGMLGWVLGVALLLYMLLIAAVGFLAA
jgi:hypothetical protein